MRSDQPASALVGIVRVAVLDALPGYSIDKVEIGLADAGMGGTHWMRITIAEALLLSSVLAAVAEGATAEGARRLAEEDKRRAVRKEAIDGT